MSRLCDKVELFVDGELPSEEAEAFRLHLADCARCRSEMENLVQFRLLGRSYLARTGVQPQAQVLRPAAFTRWRRPLFVAASLAAAVLVMVVVRLLSAPSLQSDVFLAQRPERPLEPRVSHPEADRYRPPAPKTAGAGSASERPPVAEQGEFPIEDLAVLRKRNDWQGLAAAYLVHGKPELAELALRNLEREARSPEVANDLAVASLLNSFKVKPSERGWRLKEALQLLDAALAQNPRHPQALWNRGLVLSELNLPMLAARSFSEVAALKEPGWSAEAEQKAQALQAHVTESHKRWQEAVKAGKALLEAPQEIPRELIRIPILRAYFYDAVRAAPSRERVLALLPLAQQLDALAGGQVLEQYVQRVATADFARRAPLAQDYAAQVQRTLPPERLEGFLSALLESKEDDILLGALVRAGAVSRHLKTFEEKAAASGDPWHLMIVAQEQAKAAMATGKWTQAIQTLDAARRACSAQPGVAYRCIALDRELSGLYIMLHQLDAARQQVELGWQAARAGNEWELERDMLLIRAQIARFVSDESLTRALFGEVLERNRGKPEVELRVHQDLAAVALHHLRVEEARREMDAALATGLPLTLSGAAVLSDISRLKGAPEDEKHLTWTLEKLGPGMGAGEKALATHVLGRFFIERDAERGRALLRSAIQEAGEPKLQEDGYALRARASSYTSLLLDAGKRGDFEEALALFAEERGMELPRTCLLAATVDSERTLLIARGPDGKLSGHHDASRRSRLPERLDGLVTEPLLAVLRECPQIAVLARPPLHGRAGLLPPELAWSFLSRTSAPPAPRVGPAVHLVVSDVEMPPHLSLERLHPWVLDVGPDEQRVELKGREATPSRVLEELGRATEVDLMTHGIISDSSNTSYLQLAEEKEGGESELTVARLLRASATKKFSGSPFVVLAACHAGHTSYILHEQFSLPAAFIKAGARGVLAATVEIRDLKAGDFFNAVRARMRSGATPAVALRDERVQWLRAGKEVAWVDSVLLFE
jgi:hypothetical protein